MLVSKYGFLDVVGPNIALDPSRVAAQIVSGIGFIGAGLIFVRRDSVRGLTTAAVVWVTAAIGAACGAGLVLLGVTVTAAHFLAVVGYPYVVRRLPGLSLRQAPLTLRYLDGQAVLRRVLAATTTQGFSVAEVMTNHPRAVGLDDLRPGRRTRAVRRGPWSHRVPGGRAGRDRRRPRRPHGHRRGIASARFEARDPSAVVCGE